MDTCKLFKRLPRGACYTARLLKSPTPIPEGLEAKVPGGCSDVEAVVSASGMPARTVQHKRENYSKKGVCALDHIPVHPLVPTSTIEVLLSRIAF